MDLKAQPPLQQNGRYHLLRYVSHLGWKVQGTAGGRVHFRGKERAPNRASAEEVEGASNESNLQSRHAQFSKQVLIVGRWRDSAGIFSIVDLTRTEIASAHLQCKTTSLQFIMLSCKETC
jgi:cation transport ATPase